MFFPKLPGRERTGTQGLSDPDLGHCVTRRHQLTSDYHGNQGLSALAGFFQGRAGQQCPLSPAGSGYNPINTIHEKGAS